MSLDTYTNLKTSVANWLHRSDLTDQLDDFISIAEEKIWETLRVKEMEADSTVTLSTSARTAALPTGTLEIRRIYLDASPIVHMKPLSTQQIDAAHLTSSGKPQYYAVIGTNLEFERTPDSAYTLYVNLYKKLTALSSTNATNDILTNYPTVYLYACCYAGAIYTNDDKKIAKFKPLFEEAVSMANSQTNRGKYGAGMAVRAA